MEFLYELLFTVFFALFFSLLVAKLVSIASTETTHISLSKAQRIVDDDVVIEKRCEGGTKLNEDGMIARLTVEGEIFESVGGDGDRFESSGTTGEKNEKIEVDDVDEEIVHLTVDDEISESVGGDCDRFKSSGTIGEKTEGNEVDDVAVEKRCEEVKLEEVDEVEEEIEHLRAEDKIVENFGGDCGSNESSGTIGGKTEENGVDDVAVEKRCEEVKLEELDEVEEEIEHLRAEDEIVENFGGDCGSNESSGTICEKIENIGVDEAAVERRFGEAKSEEFDRFESSGTVCESIEKTVVDDVEVKRCEKVKLEEFNDVDEEYAVKRFSEERIIGHLTVDGTIVKDVGGVSDSFESSGDNSDILEKIETEGDSTVKLGDSDPVGDVAVEEGSKMGKFVEQVWTRDHTFKSSGANNDIIESIGVEGDIMVNSGRNNHAVTYEVAVGDKSDERELEEFEHKIVENVGVNNVNSESSGTNAESVENVLVGGDIKLSSFNEVDEDDDWEGIERSELEESFAAAANYVFRGDKNVSEPKLDSNVKMDLYGLNKVALEGPCREAQPMAIMVSARAKWNAWQKLGNMTPEVAMEHYISLLSEKAPEWMEWKSSGDGSKYSSMVSEASPPDIGFYTETQLNPIEERASELNSAPDEEDLTVGSISVNKI